MTDSDTRPVRFGVIGTGGIAATFTDDLALLAPDTPAEVVAVGSRTQASADEFAAAHGVPRAHGSYDALLADPDVDVVYVATPHPWHHPVALDAARAGKHLLIEKPFTMTGDEAQEVVDAVRAAGVFCMEAMWARWNPHMVAVREVLASGVLGEVVSVVADHAQWFEHDPSHRVLAPELGGGALLDLGVYPVSFASMVLGTPSRVTARASAASTGVDAQTSIVLEYPSGAHAVLSTTLLARGSNRAAVVGTDGRLEIDEVWYAPTSFTVTPREGDAWTWDEPHEGHGLRHEAAEVVRCLRAGLLESPVLPLDETVAIMRTLDAVREQSDL